MITTFLFDLGGVLFTNGTKIFIHQLSTSYSIPEEKVKDMLDGDIGSQYREAKITRDEFWRQVKENLKIDNDVNLLEKQWIDGYELISGTRQIIEDLSKKYKIYYLSDNVKERVDALDKKFDFKKLFQGGIFSHEVGVRKPDPKIYEYALSVSGSLPNETVFIDDKQKMLDPAAKMGMKTILFTSPERLKENLEDWNLL
ncbi:HAD family phosphatase [Candidatus Roizmanbacteria bacterium]|nr:HAD family phosphatase [Candidatus Roizmanbacteria bacterium]